LLSRGAKLVTNLDKFDAFIKLGVAPSYSSEEAIERATVVIDCTPKGIGLENKRLYYEKYKNKVKGFIAQGSEDGFGSKFAHHITPFPKNKFVQIVSCNTHSIASIIKSLECYPSPQIGSGGIISGDFVCIRRASDISQDEDFIPAIQVDKHKYGNFGTHHAQDAFNLLKNQLPHIKLFSSSIVTNTQYMHAVRFTIETDSVNNFKTREDVITAFKKNPMVALTNKTTSNRIFGFGRDYGLYGRILNQTVICAPTIEVSDNIIRGFSFTPQDGNSLLSSISATLNFLDAYSAEDRLSCLKPYIFKEI